MAGGTFATLENGRQYESKITMYVLVTCFVAAMGGLLFGYDLRITGGVTSMEPFLIKFFPSVYRQMKDESNHESQYCKFNNQILTLFTLPEIKNRMKRAQKKTDLLMNEQIYFFAVLSIM